MMRMDTLHSARINGSEDTYRVEIQIGVDLLIIGDKWLIITGLIYTRESKELNKRMKY
jgi:hypothetical protein